MSSTISLTSSYPFSLDDLNAAEARLWQRFPADFRTFYTQQNGGIVAPSAPRVFKFDDERNFPDGRVFHGNSNWILAMWGYVGYEQKTIKERDDVRSILHQHINRHVDEDFLPTDVYAFAGCEQSCLLTISLRNDETYGRIYYWDYYWNYPWYKKFFDERIVSALAPFGDERKKILNDFEHPRRRELADALNFATLFDVGASFSSFLASLCVSSESE